MMATAGILSFDSFVIISAICHESATALDTFLLEPSKSACLCFKPCFLYWFESRETVSYSAESEISIAQIIMLSVLHMSAQSLVYVGSVHALQHFV